MQGNMLKMSTSAKTKLQTVVKFGKNCFILFSHGGKIPQIGCLPPKKHVTGNTVGRAERHHHYGLGSLLVGLGGSGRTDGEGAQKWRINRQPKKVIAVVAGVMCWRSKFIYIWGKDVIFAIKEYSYLG